MRNIYGGGATTNINGCRFEQETSLKDILINNGYQVFDEHTVCLNNENLGYIYSQAKFSTEFLRNLGIDYRSINSKRWDPDEAFINETDKTIYILEKKFQSSSGSVDEKLATFEFKKYEYEKLVSRMGYKVKYMYILARNWFNHPRYRDYFEYMNYKNCPYYFNDEFTLEAIGLQTL